MLQVTTVNGDQFVCLNLNNQEGDQNGNNTSTYVATSEVNQCYTSLSDTYATNPDLNGVNPTAFVTAPFQNQQQPHQLNQFGTIQAPVHSQVVIQRVGTLPRQYAHPLAQM